MKLLSLLVLLPVLASVARGDDYAAYQIGWPNGYFANAKVSPKMEAHEAGLDMNVVYWGEKPADLKLWEVGEDFLSGMTAHQFAIIGRYQSTKIANGSTLEMLCHFTPEKLSDPELVYSSKMPIVGETGASDKWQTFILPFDVTGAKTHLVKIEWKLHLTGGYGSNLGFDQVYLRQYPDGKFPVIASGSKSTHLQGGDNLPAILPSPIPSVQPAFQVIAPALASPPNSAPLSSLTREVPLATPASRDVPPPPTEIYRDVPAGQTVEPMPWNMVPPLPPTVAGKIVGQMLANDLSNVLEIGYSGPAPLDVKLRTVPYTVEAYLPPVTTHHYAIVGDVRCENVAAGTYLEMWSHFTSSVPGAPDEAYFSRTLGDHGPMGKLEGTHDWREFWLPFDSTGTKSKLTQLDFNLHFAGYGDVYLSNLRLVQYPDAPLPAESTAPGMQIIAELPVDKYADTAQNMGPGEKMTLVDGEDGNKNLVVTRAGDNWYTKSLVEVPEDLLHKVTAPRFGFTGEVKCAQATTILGMGLGFVARLDPLPEITEPRSEISQGNEWKTFEVQFDRGHSGYVLEHLGLWLNFYGSATVQLRHLRLVQYPEEKTATPPITLAQADGVMAGEGKDVFKIIWFCLGAAATGLALLATSGLIMAARVWQRRHHERELRRIASLHT